MTCLVSVIMPVYNSVEYLHETVSSILHESSREFELLLIDDGSSDGSSELCDQLSKQDKRIRVIHKDNGGMCQARNVGLQNAKGKWVAFSDNDDLVLPGFIDSNLKIAKKYDCDCLVFGREWAQIDNCGNIQYLSKLAPTEMKCYTGEEVIDAYFECAKLSDGVWVRFYKRSMLENNQITFDESFRSGFEDSLFNDMVIQHARSYAFNPDSYYRWIHRASHSTSMKVSENRLNSLNKLLEYEFHLMTDTGMLDANKSQCARLLFSRIFDILVTNHISGRSIYKQEIELYDTLRSIINPYRSLLQDCSLPLSLEAAKRLLLKQQYASLFFYLKLGSIAKMKLNRRQRRAL